MRDIVIKCDRCGQLITEDLIKISMEKVHRMLPNMRREYIGALKDLDFCTQCAHDIKSIIMVPLYQTGEGDGNETPQDS